MIDAAREHAQWLHDNPGSLSPGKTYDHINAAIISAEHIERLADELERLVGVMSESVRMHSMHGIYTEVNSWG